MSFEPQRHGDAEQMGSRKPDAAGIGAKALSIVIASLLSVLVMAGCFPASTYKQSGMQVGSDEGFSLYKSDPCPSFDPPGYIFFTNQFGVWNFKDSTGLMNKEARYGNRDHARWWAWSWFNYCKGHQPKPPASVWEPESKKQLPESGKSGVMQFQWLEHPVDPVNPV